MALLISGLPVICKGTRQVAKKAITGTRINKRRIANTIAISKVISLVIILTGHVHRRKRVSRTIA